MPIPSRALLVSAAAVILFLCLGTSRAERSVTPLNDGWKFIRSDAGLFSSSQDWESVQLPHTWNAKDGQAGPEITDQRESEEAALAAQVPPRSTDQEHGKSGYYRGACWYERTLDIPEEWRGKRRIFVRFEAASTVARVFLNGTLLGEHRGGFTAFCYELTDFLNYGGTNQLRVQVDNSHREDLVPLSGDFNLFGGLYRPAALIVTDALCISPLDYASSGVYLTTRDLRPAQARVEVRAVLSDHTLWQPRSKDGKKSNSPAAELPPAELRAEVLDAEGRIVAESRATQDIPAEATRDCVMGVTIPNPRLWNGRADPYLYTVRVVFSREGVVLDEVRQPLGLRTVAITEKEGFLLNGKPYPVHGVNRHQDVRDKGWALSAADEEMDAALMKEMGVTAVRNAHYPQSESWHRINDREGVLLWDEVSLVNETRPTRAFWLNSEESLREMIHQLYNHPSVVWWGIFNELGNRGMSESDEGLTRLKQICQELDPGRLVVGATNRLNRSFNQIPQFICLNAYPGWYSPKPPGDIAAAISSLSSEVGGKRVGVSEYGAGANIAHHTEGQPVQPKHNGPFHPEEWQSFFHEGTWGAICDNPQVWGSFVWNMFDFAVQGRREGNLPALNDKGLVTHDRRFRKDAFWFYKANWTTAPMVHITSSRLTPRQSATTDVKVYSNCDEVELRVNGALVGTAKPDALRISRFPAVSLISGENHAEVVGRRGKVEVKDACQWTVEPGAF